MNSSPSISSLHRPGLEPAIWRLIFPAFVLLLAGCAAPIGADRVSTRQAYKQVDSNALRSGKPSDNTEWLLHRYSLQDVAARAPDEAVRQLHQKAVKTGDRELLFALAELSYLAGERISQSVKPWDKRDERDYYLGSAVYAWLYLFGEGKEPLPGPFQRRFREACDLYNYSLGLALIGKRSTNAVVQLANGRRRLPVGEIELQLSSTNLDSPLDQFDQLLLADAFRVRGLSTRNREAGLGAPLLCVGQWNAAEKIRRTAPATIFLRGPASLADASSGKTTCALELFSSLNEPSVTIGSQHVPIETDLTTYRAYTLNQSYIWSIGLGQFLAPAERGRSQLMLNQPYERGRIPLVFVHGTFSSPVTWAEMANSLTADPDLRKRYQIWSFVYSSGNPLPVSAGELRDSLTETIHKLDPEGTDAALRKMVIIGHSQGGLLVKLTATDTGDRIWNAINTNRLENLKISEPDRERIRQMLFLKPLPFVSRVIFISTPHHGSYLAGGLARQLAWKLMSLPSAMVTRGKRAITLANEPAAEKFFSGRVPTSLDSMSPKNPVLLALADIPVSPEIKAHSIIPVLGSGDYHKGRDGLVTYTSAHVSYVESEYIVRFGHSCLGESTAIEEVRRILHEHLDQNPKPAP